MVTKEAFRSVMLRHCRTFSHCVFKSQTNHVLSKPVRILLPWSPLTCTTSPRAHSTNIKMRSYLQYMKRKVKGAPAPPYDHVCQVGDPVLRSQAAVVEPGAIQSPEVQKVIKTLVKLRVLDGRTVIFQEACESICGFSASVPRYLSVEVSGLNEKAEPVSWQASGWPARILQHEMDHLSGVLYIDRMDSKTFINVKWEEYNE
ncbi:peptide deformylase, mitochondrial isoform X3 [Carassius gibelio]|uniref:peptide deformylase, mitochondrial isoform X3 n=1 Tax=Carassius gibelio TaxID=101364 RepID=UPI002277DE50|nr:peptide deformylase, mitochondrial isoform X3 [Carassius gibelio]